MPGAVKSIRVLYAEIGRLLNHLMNICAFAMDVGAMTPMLWGFEHREKLMEFCERACGARMHMHYFRPAASPSTCRNRCWMTSTHGARDFLQFCDDIESLLTENRIFKQRTVDIGVITAEQCQDWGITGANLRASGVAWDLRKSQPYDGYEKYDFQIPVGKNGDCYDRYLVRMLEMRESVKIMQQAIENMPGGPAKSIDHKITPPTRGEMKHSMEALIHHFKLYTEGFKVPAGETYTRRRSAQGRIRGVFDFRRHQQAVPLQNPGTGIRLVAGDRVDPKGICWPTWSPTSAPSMSCSGRLTDDAMITIRRNVSFSAESKVLGRSRIAKYPKASSARR